MTQSLQRCAFENHRLHHPREIQFSHLKSEECEFVCWIHNVTEESLNPTIISMLDLLLILAVQYCWSGPEFRPSVLLSLIMVRISAPNNCNGGFGKGTPRPFTIEPGSSDYCRVISTATENNKAGFGGGGVVDKPHSSPIHPRKSFERPTCVV